MTLGSIINSLTLVSHLFLNSLCPWLVPLVYSIYSTSNSFIWLDWFYSFLLLFVLFFLFLCFLTIRSNHQAIIKMCPPSLFISFIHLPNWLFLSFSPIFTPLNTLGTTHLFFLFRLATTLILHNCLLKLIFWQRNWRITQSKRKHFTSIFQKKYILSSWWNWH